MKPRLGLALLLALVLLIPGSAWAPGNCAIFRSWNDGDTFTGPDATTSMTTVGVTNMTAQCLDDYSQDVTQMRLNTDPFPSGSESLATSAAGELERIRYILKKITGWTQWYAHTEASAIIQNTQTFRGLHLRTHPDSDVAASKVMLVRADEIVMDTGHRVADWDRLVAAITVSGAGGLDTGAEAASTWYEVYAIRKSTDGTKNLLLHRAKDYLQDQAQTAHDVSINLRRATAPVQTELAQGFKLATAGKVEFADIILLRTGSVVGNIWLEVQADSAGDPTGTALATSDKLAASKVTTAAQEIRFPFRNPASLSTATQYHLVLKGDYTASDTVHISWRSDSTAPGYADGTFKALDGGTWTDLADDAWFKLYVTRNDAAVTMPTGYDQKALLAHTLNDSASNLQPFVALDRRVRKDELDVGQVATGPALMDMRLLFPPIPVLGSFSMKNSNTSAHRLSIAPVPDGFDDGAGPGFMGVSTWAPTSGTVRVPLQDLVPVVYGGIYARASADTTDISMTGWTW